MLHHSLWIPYSLSIFSNTFSLSNCPQIILTCVCPVFSGILMNIKSWSSLPSNGAEVWSPIPFPMSYWLFLAFLIHCGSTSHWHILLFEVLILVAFKIIISLGYHQTALQTRSWVGREKNQSGQDPCHLEGTQKRRGYYGLIDPSWWVRGLNHTLITQTLGSGTRKMSSLSWFGSSETYRRTVKWRLC